MSIKNLLFAFCTLSLSLFFNYARADQLVFAVDIIRHGDRSPVIEIPKSPHRWPQDLGELSAEGMQQAYQLGKSKHAQYIEQNHLLPEHYVSNTMSVRSSDFNRTLMSAESFLLGLYPPASETMNEFTLPASYQPIPIHTVPLKEETLVLPNPKKFKALRAKYIESQKDYQEKEAQYKNKLALWQKITGVRLKNLDGVIHLADNLYIRELHHVPLPKGISQKTADEIITLGNWLSVSQFEPYPIGIAASKELIAQISADFTQASQQKSTLKYALFSAHDSTLLCMLSALHNPQSIRPNYAADLNFLLYKTDANEFYVKVTYENKPVVIPGCGEKCPLEKFNQLT